jgi:adenylate cyclase
MQRKLITILAADVVGYSRLASADEEGTVSRLRAVRQELVDPVITANGGRVFKDMGDGRLAEFPSVVGAVRCALDVQRAMMARNANIAPDKRIEFRVGIHLGDVIVESDGDLMGDGVNIAARLEGICEPGGVCLSEDAYRQVRDKLDVAFTDLGDKELKNIPRPARAYSAVLDRNATASTPLAAAAPDEPLAPSDKPSIAVLPFTNMSGDPEQEYFADGIVEDIITGLSRIKWLFVVARNSSFVYKGNAVDVKRVGSDLGVRYVLEGSVRKAANRVRITGQVVETGSGRHVWAERYDRTLDDIFSLQDEITMSVVAAIEPSLRQAEIERVKRKRPDSLHAYDLVLRALADGRASLSMPEPAATALRFLDQALELEPNYALAHAYAAACNHVLYLRGDKRNERRLAAIRHARCGIAFGQDDAAALSMSGFIIGMDEHDRAAALQAFEAALALSPSTAFAYMAGSVVFGWAGDAKRAIEWAESALRLNPLDPLQWYSYHGQALGHFVLGRNEEAAAAARRAIQLNPGMSISHMLLAAPLSRLGRLDEGKASIARLLELQPNFDLAHHLAGVDCERGLAAALTEALSGLDLPAS